MRKTLISYIPLLCAVLLIGGMAGAADAFQNKEIIFPEIAAIATGALLTPKLAWRTDPLHIFSAIAVCALLGVCIVLWMPGAVWLQMSAAYLLASVLLLISRKISSDPMNHLGSVRHETASAPAASYSAAIFI